MVEAQKFRVEQEMTNLVNELDRSYLRKMQVSEVMSLIACKAYAIILGWL